MTVPEIARSEISEKIPELLSGRNCLAVVPHTTDLEWVAEVTWEFARAAATEYRSVTLVELNLDSPILESGCKVPVEEGIVDAFLYGASLSHVTVTEEETGLNFIGSGTFTAEPDEIWNSSRWPQVLDALSRPHSIIVFALPAEALEKLNVALDGIIIASPSGYSLSSDAASPTINRALTGGIPLLSVITGLVTAAPAAPVVAATGPESIAARAGRRAGWIYGLIAVVAVAAISYSILGTGEPAPESPATPAVGPGESPPSDPPVQPVVQEPADRGLPADSLDETIASITAFTDADSLFWGVQVASVNSFERVLSFTDEVAQRGFAAMVTPVRLRSGAIWYRISVGTLADSAAAADLQSSLWATPLLNESEGQVTRTPHTFELGNLPEGTPAEIISTLRERGVPAYILAAADGTPRVLFGAFASESQASLADSILSASGITTTLVRRLGYSQ